MTEDEAETIREKFRAKLKSLGIDPKVEYEMWLADDGSVYSFTGYLLQSLPTKVSELLCNSEGEDQYEFGRVMNLTRKKDVAELKSFLKKLEKLCQVHDVLHT